MIRKVVVPALLAGISSILLACGGHGTTPQAPPPPNIAGAWEFRAFSDNNGTSFTGIEVALKEGKTLISGVQQPNGQVSATGATQISIVSINATDGSVVFGGQCPAAAGGTYSLSGSVVDLSGPFNFSYTENGNVFEVTATLSGDGKSVIGSYTSAAGSLCTDSGSITGTAVPKLSGTYVGQLTLPDGAANSVTVTFAEDSNSVVTVNLVALSPDNLALTMTGPATGNSFVVQGTFQGNLVQYEGYFEPVYDPLTQLMVPGVYFVNATNAEPAYAGTLIPPVN